MLACLRCGMFKFQCTSLNQVVVKHIPLPVSLLVVVRLIPIPASMIYLHCLKPWVLATMVEYKIQIYFLWLLAQIPVEVLHFETPHSRL